MLINGNNSGGNRPDFGGNSYNDLNDKPKWRFDPLKIIVLILCVLGVVSSLFIGIINVFGIIAIAILVVDMIVKKSWLNVLAMILSIWYDNTHIYVYTVS